jgi:hypothetical protein
MAGGVDACARPGVSSRIEESDMARTRSLTCVVFLIAVASPLPVAAQHAQHAGGGRDADAIRSVVTEAYIEGIQKNGSRDAIRRGFHPGFVMKVLSNGQLSDVTIEQWIARMPAAGTPPRGRIEHRFPAVAVTGDAAVATVDIDIDGKHVFTDYISLYRFPEGWRIVGKIFYRHPG